MTALLNPVLGKAHPISVRNENDFYGASRVAARYCGIPFDASIQGGAWQHSWGPDYMNHHPLLISQPLTAVEQHWVARRSQADALTQAGYSGVRAIGLPIVYLPRPRVERRAGTLLAMPAHSLDTSPISNARFEGYADAIASVKDQFERVIAVIHPACIRNGYWVDALRRRGLDVVPGFDFIDGAAFWRMGRLFSWADCVTTNAYGSAIMYASFFGARVSVFGPYVERDPADYRNEAIYLKHPGFAEVTCDALSEKRLRAAFPWLFTNPADALSRRSWAEAEAGLQDRLSPTELRREFEWTPGRLAREGSARLLNNGRQIATQLWHRGPGRAQRSLHRRLDGMRASRSHRV